MEFIKQLVAFALYMGAGNNIMLQSPGDVLDTWSHCINAQGERELAEPMSQENKALFILWPDRSPIMAVKEGDKP